MAEPPVHERGGGMNGGAAMLNEVTLNSDTIDQFDDDPDFVRSLARGMAVLSALGGESRRKSVSMISSQTGLERAVVRRALYMLSLFRFAKADDQGRFCLQPRVLSLHHAFLSSSQLALVAQPVLDHLGETLGQSVSLAVLDCGEGCCLVRSVSSRVISSIVDVGRRFPAYGNPVGYALLTQLLDGELETYMAHLQQHELFASQAGSRDRLREIVMQAREELCLCRGST